MFINFFCHKIFQILVFLCKKSNLSPWKTLPPLSQKSPSKNWDPVKSLLFKNLVRGSTPEQKEGVHTMEQKGKLLPNHYYINFRQAVNITDKLISLDDMWYQKFMFICANSTNFLLENSRESPAFLVNFHFFQSLDFEYGVNKHEVPI